MRTLKSPAPTKEFLKRSTISSPRFCPATREVAIRGPTTLTSKVFAAKTSVSTNALKTSRPTLSNGRKLSVRDSCGWRKCNPSSTRNFKPYKIHSRNHERPFPSLFVLAGLVFCSCRKFEQEKVVAALNRYANQPLPGRATSFLFQSRGCTALLSCGSGYAAIGLRRWRFSSGIAQERIFETIRFSQPTTEDSLVLPGYPPPPISPKTSCSLDEQTGANGVLFVDLDSYRPYRPMSLGVRRNWWI